MAEEKKPKIDLKARLGKNQPAAATPPPSPISSKPLGAGPIGGGVPVPPGSGVAPPPALGHAPATLDPSNPLAAAAQPYRAPAPAPPPQPARIEVDEVAVKDAARGALKKGVMIGMVGAVLVGAVTFIAGGAQENSKGRQRSVADAKFLSGEVTKAKDQLKSMAEKMDAGRNTLVKDKKFPDTLAKDLGAMNIDFDGQKLGGVRFAAFQKETPGQLIEFITAVQTLNDRKLQIINLLNKLQKPLTDQLAQAGKANLIHVVVIDKDQSGNLALLSALKEPLPLSAAPPASYTVVNPLSKSASTINRYTGGDLSKAAAIPVVPKSFDANCPSETAGLAAQLASQINKFVVDIQGEKAGPADPMGAVVDSKPHLIERAEKLETALKKIGD